MTESAEQSGLPSTQSAGVKAASFIPRTTFRRWLAAFMQVRVKHGMLWLNKAVSSLQSDLLCLEEPSDCAYALVSPVC